MLAPFSPSQQEESCSSILKCCLHKQIIWNIFKSPFAGKAYLFLKFLSVSCNLLDDVLHYAYVTASTNCVIMVL